MHRHQLRVFLVVLPLTAMLVGVRTGPARGAGAPVSVTPADHLVNGQTVTATATGFVAESDTPLGRVVPTAYECANDRFPEFAVFDRESFIEMAEMIQRDCEAL